MSLTSQPYSLEELDEHPDSHRIWATIMAIKEEADEYVQRAYDSGYSDGLYDRREGP
jgi:hypothetical protein